ncbi:MAG: UPF0182 family protein, partial [Nocardioidaceae bacterium]|nr:UPF0182 family protein [Nocardioidaceae bacterium]
MRSPCWRARIWCRPSYSCCQAPSSSESGQAETVSGFFDEPPQQPRRTAVPPPPSQRSRAIVLTAIVLVVLFFLTSVFTGVWTDRLWFSSLGYSAVFTKMLGTRVLLFVVFGLLLGIVVGLNIALAYRFRPIFRPASSEQV